MKVSISFTDVLDSTGLVGYRVFGYLPSSVFSLAYSQFDCSGLLGIDLCSLYRSLALESYRFLTSSFSSSFLRSHLGCRFKVSFSGFSRVFRDEFISFVSSLELKGVFGEKTLRFVSPTEVFEYDY
ncbi:hypothetical protein [Dipodfec virus UOA04_Rod_1027]|nr:hypothetical protein [Dipodfec virus UOA04_Rod_1027]